MQAKDGNTTEQRSIFDRRARGRRQGASAYRSVAAQPHGHWGVAQVRQGSRTGDGGEVVVEVDEPGDMRTIPRSRMQAQQDDTTEQRSSFDRRARG